MSQRKALIDHKDSGNEQIYAYDDEYADLVREDTVS